MKFYVDIADLGAIRRIAEFFPIEGFTTNPKSLTKAPTPLPALMAEYREFVEQTGLTAFVQTTAETADGMLAQAKALQAYFGDHVVVKLPAVPEGYRAVRLCKAAGIPVCVTVVHSMTQALVAAAAGADYVAPYVSRIDNLGADGVACVTEMVTAFRNGGYACQVLGASFRTVDQVRRLAVAGCQAVTLMPELFDQLIAHPATDKAMVDFRTVWQDTFGQTEVTDFLPGEA